MAREYINPTDVAPPPGNLYNNVVKVGATVYISGQVSRDLNGRTIYAGDVERQFRQVWGILEKAMKAAGGSINDIVKMTTYVVGADNIGKLRQAREDLQPLGGRPASTMVVVAALAGPDLLVEVEAVAILSDRSLT